MHISKLLDPQVLHNAKLYRYHFLAHRFGEVYCATCHTCILGHHYQVGNLPHPEIYRDYPRPPSL
jgi:hypothetical protein